MTSIYEQLGGSDGVQALVDAFYDTMEELPQAAAIRAMHPSDLASSRAHLHLFLNMWMGGPRDYMEQRGHPRMRARHLPFPIDEGARDAWLACMKIALEARVPDENLRADLFSAFARIADHMRNQ